MSVDDASRFRGNRDVGQQSSDQTSADGGPMDGADDRLVAIDQVVDQIARLLPDSAAQLKVGSHVRHHRKVAAAGESLAFAAQHGATHRIIVAKVAPDLAQLAVPFAPRRRQLAVQRPHLDIQHAAESVDVRATPADPQRLVV